jgi:hypothetical protein
VIQGSYYLSGDSVLFQAGIMDVASGQMLRSFDPVGAPVERAMDALETLRERIAGGLSPLVNPEIWAGSVEPDLVPPPSLPAYREFMSGIQQWFQDEEAAIAHYRRAARLDSTFDAPLIQLAIHAMWDDECSITDSIGAVLDRRRDHLATWNRITIDLLRAQCRGDMAEAVNLLAQLHGAYPRSVLAGGRYVRHGLLPSNQPRAAREMSNRIPSGPWRGLPGTGGT